MYWLNHLTSDKEMEFLDQIVKISFAEQIAEKLRKQILSGALKPGEKLPSERDLAVQFGTNRNTLREAIRFLEGLKLVTVRQGAGVTVADFHNEGDMALLPYFIMEGGDIPERRAALADALALRRTVLSSAAELAAERRTEEDIAAMKEKIQKIRTIALDEDVALEDLEFYHTLVKSAHSLVSKWMFNTFLSVYIKALPVAKSIWVTPPNYLDGLLSLVAAIEKSDSEKAGEIIKSNLGASDEIVLDKLSTIFR
ncbi:MAG: FadR/GntR family transcriptional regulator [Myxococcota bacterium]